MKKKVVIPALVTLLSSTIVAVMTATIAWFSSKVSVTTEDNLTGSSDGAYFAYGTGSASDDESTVIKEGPYGIETPRQLYNLAWLQYLGYFNKPEGGTITPVYFELNADIDMTGWILPPIGTTAYPFIGEFNGQNHKISNLTISNDYAEIRATNKMPSKIRRDGSISNVNIVGMFGVIGELNNNITATYDTSVTKVKDFTISGATIKNSATNTLAGIAAGYVNGPLSNVAITSEGSTASNITTVDASNLSSTYSQFTNISEYGVVGYCEEEYLGEVKSTVTETYNATSKTYDYIAQDEGDQSGWGGSIDMRTMYDGLLNVYNSYSNNSAGIYKYYDTRTIVEDVDGDVLSDNQTGPHNNSQLGYASDGSSYTLVHYGYEQKNSNNQVTSSYTIARRNTSQYLYLYGHNDAVVGGTQTVTKTYYPERPVFSINSSSHYMMLNGENIQDTTNSSNATKWYYDSEAYIKTTADNGATFTYLSCDNTYNLIGTTNQNLAVKWTKDTSGNNTDFSFTQSGISYHIYYDSGWVLKTTDAPYYYIRSGSNYLSRDGANNLKRETTRANATKWYLAADNYFYPGDDDSMALVYYYRRNNWDATTNALYVYDATSSYSILYHPNDAMTQITAQGKTYSWRNGEQTNTYYVRYSGNSWSGSTTSSTVTIEEVSPTSPYYVLTPGNGNMKMKDTETYSQDATYETKHTYFPLRQEDNNGVPMDTNTGYVISGSDDSMAGDIRVSYYSKSGNLPNGVNTVYTINDSGRQTVTSNGTNQAIASTFSKYTASRTSMQSILTGSNIYGLHFMDAQISYGEGISAVAESATINGETYTNYELPTNCIDFNLKEKGYINFFAGTYFSGNNSFFSLFQVERDGSQKITAVKKIAEVLTDGSESHSYQYKFSDGTYSVPFMFSNGNKVTLSGGTYTQYSTMASAYTNYTTTFKTSWIEKNSLASSYAYYFEIPMNDGEYCLGSVDGGTGAYLMYLDIGANAKKIYRSEIIEYFKWIDKVYSYPKGVFIMAAGTTNASDQNSYCIRLGDSYSGTLKMERTGNEQNDEAKYTGTGNASKEAVSYKFPVLTLKDEDDTVVSMDSITPTSTTTNEIRRLSYLDYNMNNNSTTKIVVTDTYVNNVKTGRTVEKYKNYNIETNTGTADDTIDVYYVSGGVVTNVTKNTGTINFNVSGNSTKILSFDIAYPNGATISITFTLSVTATESDGHYEYTPKGYEYTITLTRPDGTKEEIKAYVVVSFYKNNDGTYTYTFKINNDNITGTSTTPIVITVPAVQG